MRARGVAKSLALYGVVWLVDESAVAVLEVPAARE